MDFRIFALILTCIEVSVAQINDTYEYTIPESSDSQSPIKSEHGKNLKHILEQELKFQANLDIIMKHYVETDDSNAGNLPTESLIAKSDAEIILDNQKYLAKAVHIKRPLYNYTDTRFRKKLFYHLRKQGLEQIKDFENFLRNNVEACNDTNYILHGMTDKAATKYVMNIANHYKNISVDIADGRPTNELLLAALIETCNDELNAQKTKMLQKYARKLKKDTKNIDFDVINNKLATDNVKNKKRDYIWVCLKVRVCKPYPGFSNYLAEILNFILKLSDYEYKSILSTVRKIITNSVIDDFIDKNNREKIIKLMFPLKTEESHIFLKNIIKAISNKNTFDPDENLVTLSQKILIEMLDKVFYRADDLVKMEYEMTIDALKTWKSSEVRYVDTDLNGILLTYVENMIKQCHAAWKIGYKTEVNTLIEVIINGESKNATIANDIFSNGSSYINKINTIF